MEELIITRLEEASGSECSIEVLADKISAIEPAVLDQVNWETSFPYCPSVKVRTAYTDKDLIIQFEVREKRIIARMKEINSGVCRDSCVEFFFEPEEGKGYYNLEMSCIGIPHLAFGKGRGDREFVNPFDVSRIRLYSSLGSENFQEKENPEGFHWFLTAALPLDIVGLENPAGRKIRGNFYKCGDDLSVPHYVTWAHVQTEAPDYHRPEYFGKISFR